MQSKMNTLEKLFDCTKRSLLKLEEKEKLSRDKDDELVRLRLEKARFREEIRAELKEDF